MKLMLLLLAGLTSNAVFAHAGHEHHSSALLSGLLHPFSGLDHLLLALGLGVLLVRSAQFARDMPSAAGQSAVLFLAGMLCSMLGLYAIGLLIGRIVHHSANNGSIVVARVLAVVTAAAVALG